MAIDFAECRTLSSMTKQKMKTRCSKHAAQLVFFQVFFSLAYV